MLIIDKTIKHVKKAKTNNPLILLDEMEDIAYAKNLLIKALDIIPVNHLDKMYLNKIKLLLENL